MCFLLKRFCFEKWGNKPYKDIEGLRKEKKGVGQYKSAFYTNAFLLGMGVPPLCKLPGIQT